MRKSILIAISLLLAIIFALSGCSKPTEPKPEETTSDPLENPAYIIENSKCAVFVPDGSSDYDELMWHIKMNKAYLTYPGNRIINDELSDPRGLVAGKIDELISQYWKLHTNTDVKAPSWYGGRYITYKPGYGIDTPYYGDGSDESFKYCILIVEGMEESATEFMELVKEYEEHIIYKTVKHSYNQRQEFLDTVLYPALREIGVRPAIWEPMSDFDAIECKVFEEYFTEEALSLVKRLANEYDQNIVITVTTIVF